MYQELKVFTFGKKSEAGMGSGREPRIEGIVFIFFLKKRRGGGVGVGWVGVGSGRMWTKS